LVRRLSNLYVYLVYKYWVKISSLLCSERINML